MVCTGPGNFNGIRASISAMKGVCCSLPIQLIGVNKFQALSKTYESALISLKYRGNKIYWSILKNEELIFMSSSEIGDIKISDDFSDLIVIGYRAEEIAANIKAEKFIERNNVSIQDFLEYSRKIESLEKFPPKPLYITPSQSLFAKYKGPKILDRPLNVS